MKLEKNAILKKVKRNKRKKVKEHNLFVNFFFDRSAFVNGRIFMFFPSYEEIVLIIEF